ncbi:MAG: hypothetical protein KF777_23600 [Planctomycetaceae bacterium]|nr:hypothetical protein [Planctomycetaceae bacterium]
MFRALPSLACLFSVTVTPSWALAQSNVAAVPLEANDSGYVSLDQEAFSGGVTWNGTYFDVRNQSGSGMGYTHGFTQFGAFRPFWMGDDAFIALNGRLNVIGNGDWGFNTGVVARRLANDADRFYGVNAYWDRDRTYRGNEYTQFGFGFETLGESWDFRANGYVPTGTDTNNLGVVGLSSTPYFFGNRIGFTGYERFEQALAGGDFEFGIPLLPDTSWLRGYAGMYAYQQDLGEDPVGFRGRIEGWVSDDLSVGVQVTHDKQFNTYVNAMVDWRFAGFKPTRYFPNLSTRERMLMPVQRQWRITVGEYVDTRDVLAINPRDDVPYFVVWVDNSNAGPGDGTYENPYSTLPGGTLPNETDLLLVRRGNTTQANPLSGNVVLPDYARMLGEGKAHVFDAYANFGSYNVTLDNAVLPDPAFTNSGAYPFLSSNLGPIVTLGDHNEVSAFVMRNANGAAIRGFGTDGFHLNNLEIAGNLGGGIVINNATGSGNITADGQVINGALITNINRNTVVGYTPVIPGAGNNVGGGIVIDSGAAGLELTISQVSMNSSPGVQQFGVRLVADTGDIELVMNDVQTSGGNVVAGVSLESAGRVFLADVIDLESSNNVGSGIDVLGDGAGSRMTVNLFDPVANGNDTYGLQVIATNGAQIGDPLTAGLDGVNVIDGDFSFSGLDAISVFADGGSNVDLFVDPTLANFAARHGLRFEVAGGSTFVGRFEQTNFNNAGSDATVNELDGPGGLGRGIFGLVDGANSVANVLLLDSTATTAGDDGMYIGASANGRANVTVTNTSTLPTFDNAGRAAAGASAVEVSARTGGDAVVTLNNATGNFTDPTTNNDSGLTVNATDGGSTTLVQVTNGGFNNAGVNALSVGATNFGRSQVFLDNTNGNNAGADAVVALASGGSRIDLSLDTGEFDNAGQLGVTGAGLRGQASFGATLNICVMDTQFNGALDQGIDLYANNSALIRTHLENGSANGNGLEGLRILSESNAGVHFRAVDYTFDGNGLVAPSDGVYVRADAAGALVGFFSSAPPTITTSANNNTGNGFNFEAVNGALLTAHLDTVEATGNAGYGIRFDASGAGTDTLLLMQGTNDISGNTAGNYSLNYNGVDNAIVTLTGSFNNSGTSGVEVDIVNSTNAFVSILGNGTTDTIDDNALHGVDVRITNAQQAGVVVAGYSSISRNGIDGVNIVLQDITGAGAVDVLGIPTTLTDMFDNGDDGVDVTFIDSAMGPIDGTLLTGTLPIITINSNVAGILNDCLPLPVDVSIDDVAVLPTSDGVLIQDMNIAQTAVAPADPTVNGIEVSLNGVTGTGIVTVANNVIADMYGNGIYTAITNNSSLGGAVYVNNTISGNLFGDGVRYEQTGGSVDIIAMLDTTAVENAGYGINVDLNGVAGNTLTAPSVVIDGSDVRDNTGRGLQGSGISVNAVDTALDTVQVTNSTFVSGNFGDGIRVFGDNSPITTLNISDNANISSNSMNGINVGLINGSDVTDLIIDNNIVNTNSPPPLPNNSFNIDVDTSTLTPQQAAIFLAAAQRWEQIIVGDLPDVGLIDDLYITANIVAIDGVGGILGAAGPTGLRGGSFLPYSGDMIFDSADVANLISAGQFDEVILHEMGHVLGFGTIWDLKGLLLNAGSANPRFSGSLATAQYNTKFGTASANTPVEGNTSGPGSADSHWRESVFLNELMTPYLDSGVPNPISSITIAQFADLGYTVNLGQADPFLVAPGGAVADGEVIRPNYVIGPNSGPISGSLLMGGGTANLSANTLNGILVTVTDSNVTNTEITRNNVLDNGLNGILVQATNATLGDLLVDDNRVSGSLGGDGVRLEMVDAAVTGTATFSNNGIGSSRDNGLNVDLTNSTIATLDIVDNNIGGAGALVGLGFLIDGNTFGQPYVITNTSQLGYNITDFSIDLAPTVTLNPPGIIWDTAAAGAPIPFLPLGGSDVITGLTTINGTAVVPPIVSGPGVDETTDNVGTILVGGGVPDDQGLIDLAFNDFNPGETFTWEADMDFIGQPGSTVLGSDLIGSDIIVNFTGGLFIQGTLQGVVGNPDAAEFVATSGNVGSGGISLNGADGILINQRAGSSIGAVNIVNNVVQQNGLHGVEFLVDDSNLGATTITDNVISGHENGDGVRLVQPDDVDSQLDFTFARNTIDGNTGGRGVNIELPHPNRLNTVLNVSFENDSITNNGQEGIRLNLTGNNNGLANNVTANIAINSGTIVNANTGLDHSDISNNGTLGLRIDANQTSDVNLVIGGNGGQSTFNNNNGAGAALLLTGSSTATMDVSNAAFNENNVGSDVNFAGQGMYVRLRQSATLNNAIIGDPTLDNTNFDTNAGAGLALEMVQSTIAKGWTVQNTSLSGNGTAGNPLSNDGLNINRSADAKFDDLLVTGSTLNNNSGDGLGLNLAGGNVDIENPPNAYVIDVDVVESDLSGNTGNGVNATLTADVRLDLDVLDSTLNRNTGSGINVTTDFDSRLVSTSLIQGNEFALNSLDGITMTAINRTQISATIDDNEFLGNTRDGLRYFNTTAPPPVGLTSALNITNNLFDGEITQTTFGQGAINARLDGGAIVSFNITDNVITHFAGAQTLPDASGVNSGLPILGGAVNLWSNSRSRLTATLTGNDIIENRGAQFTNGVNLFHTDNDGVNDLITGLQTMTVTMTDNLISNNSGRGVHALNQGFGNMNLTIQGTNDPRPSNGINANSQIEQNGLGGIVVDNDSADTPVVTSAASQRVNNNMFFTLTNTSVRGNGNTASAVSANERNGVYLLAGTSQRGQFLADVQTNFLSGNNNIDFVTQSYTATNAPPQLRWDNASFTADPLARMGLRLQQNVGDQIAVTNSGATYNNADVYKSQGWFFDGNTTRLRNAQREQVDFLDILGPQTVDNTPAPAAGTISSSGIDTVLPQGRSLLNSRLNLLAAGREITAQANAGGNSTITFTPALGAAPAVGTPFTIDAPNIAGVGTSTFRTEDLSVLDNNVFTTVVSDFTDQVGGGFYTTRIGFNQQSFTWDTGYTFPAFLFP